MEEQEQEKKPHKPMGGKREGAGRKPKDKVNSRVFGVRLREDYIALIDKHFENRSDFIQIAVKEKLRREGLI